MTEGINAAPEAPYLKREVTDGFLEGYAKGLARNADDDLESFRIQAKRYIESSRKDGESEARTAQRLETYLQVVETIVIGNAVRVGDRLGDIARLIALGAGYDAAAVALRHQSLDLL